MLEDKTKEKFIGHEEEIKLFQNWLTTTNPQEPSVLFFFDNFEAPEKKGGIGKSRLLLKCSQIAREYPDVAVVMLDFFTIRDRSGLEIARRVVAGLRQIYPDWSPTEFQNVLARREQSREQSSQETEPPVIRRALRKALLKDLASIPDPANDQRKHVIVFCDTYERVQMHPAQISLTTDHLFPDFYGLQQIGFVIAGRNPPEETLPNWRGRMPRVRPMALRSFTLAEMILYLEEYLEVSEVLSRARAIASALYDRTEGRPILVSLMTDMFNKRVVKPDALLKIAPEDFQQDLVGNLDGLEEPTTWAVLFMAHIYHRFNWDILGMLFSKLNLLDALPADGLAGVWAQLNTLSCVRNSSTSDEIVLHDEMRRLVIQWNWSRKKLDDGMRQTLSQRMIIYYDQQLAGVEDIQLKHAYEVERLYHQCYLDLASGFADFLERVHTALEHQQNIYARSLIQEMGEFAGKLSGEQDFRLRVQEAKLLQNEEFYEKALLIYNDLSQQPESAWLKEEDRAELLYEQGNCLTALSRFAEAIYALTNALERYDKLKNQQKVGVISSRIGFAYRKQGELEVAVKYYHQSLAIHRQQSNLVGYADSLNALGEVYLLQGKYNEALINCTNALQLRQKLYAEQRATALGLAFVFSSIGKIYYALKQIDKASASFEQARDNYEQSSYQHGVGAICYYSGLLALDRGELEEAKSLFKQAYDMAAPIYAEIEIMSLNKQGLIWFLRQEYDEASELLSRALARAREINDFYQQAEVSFNLATMLLNLPPFRQKAPAPAAGAQDREKMHFLADQAERLLVEAERLAKRYHYYQLLGWIMKAYGDILWRQQNYPEACRFYMDYCETMARYNDEEYSNARRFTLAEAWIGLSSDVKRDIYRQIEEEWPLRDLPEERDALMLHELDEVRLFMDL